MEAFMDKYGLMCKLIQALDVHGQVTIQLVTANFWLKLLIESSHMAKM
jgi:hypothetical protein